MLEGRATRETAIGWKTGPEMAASAGIQAAGQGLQTASQECGYSTPLSTHQATLGLLCPGLFYLV